MPIASDPVSVRRCRPEEAGEILGLVNAAAEAYRGVIPDDCWHEPYMPADELEREIAAGVEFWGVEAGGRLVGVMGVQPAGEVELIRHAYVAPAAQGSGVGGALLDHLRARRRGPMLVGTWAAAVWAIRFYQRHGFALVPHERTPEVLRRYWRITPRQIETSIVLADQPLNR
jgi:GNAT superfamily N-acetyltransferase